MLYSLQGNSWLFTANTKMTKAHSRQHTATRRNGFVFRSSSSGKHRKNYTKLLFKQHPIFFLSLRSWPVVLWCAWLWLYQLFLHLIRGVRDYYKVYVNRTKTFGLKCGIGREHRSNVYWLRRSCDEIVYTWNCRPKWFSVPSTDPRRATKCIA